MHVSSIDIQSVKVGERMRKDLGDLGALRASIEQVGLLHPIVLDEKKNLICGLRRLEVMKGLGHDLIPASIVSVKDVLRAELDENTVRQDFTFEEKMKIADYLEPKLKQEAQSRQKSGLPKLGKGGGRTSESLAAYFNEGHTTFEKERELWKAFKEGHPHADKLKKKLERNSVSSAHAVLKIYNRRQKVDDQISSEAAKRDLPEGIKFGDSLRLMRELKDKSVDSTVTSPPFYLKERPDYMNWYLEVLEQIARVTIDHAFIFNSPTRLAKICMETGERFATRPLMWYKGITQEPFRYEPIFVYRFGTERFNVVSRITRDVFPFSPPQKQERIHQDQNPIALYKELIQISGAQVILDPFLGSGTTYKACKELGRRCIGFERDESHRGAIMAE